MLYGADLPTDGVLADEVRSATREAMGSVVGIPVAPEMPGALRLDAVAVGGAANDRALSEFLRPALRWGAIAASAVLAVLLIWAGRGRGLLWWPVALAPAALGGDRARGVGRAGRLAVPLAAGRRVRGRRHRDDRRGGAEGAVDGNPQRAPGPPGVVALLGAALAAGCALPPWSMGAPLDGRPSIPATTAAPSCRRCARSRVAQRARGAHRRSS